MLDQRGGRRDRAGRPACAGTNGAGSGRGRGETVQVSPVSVAVSASGRSSRAAYPRVCIRCRNTRSTSSTPSRQTAGASSVVRRAEASRSTWWIVVSWSWRRGQKRAVPLPNAKFQQVRRGRRTAAPRRGPRPSRRTTRSPHDPWPTRARRSARRPPGRSPRSSPPRRARCRGAPPGRTPTSPGSSARARGGRTTPRRPPDARRPRRTPRRSRRWSTARQPRSRRHHRTGAETHPSRCAPPDRHALADRPPSADRARRDLRGPTSSTTRWPVSTSSTTRWPGLDKLDHPVAWSRRARPPGGGEWRYRWSTVVTVSPVTR